jgi:NTP pyrophosphatase (non-canonical NTP hydrolase)
MKPKSYFPSILEDNFISQFSEIQKTVHENAVSKGWWEENRSDGELIALMHSELSEALEALRKDLISDHIPEYEGVEEELADVVIRIMDMAERRGYRVASAIIDKIHFNKERPYKHGGKKF